MIDEDINNVWTQIGSVTGKTTQLNATGLTAGTSYSFEVTAANASGSSTSQPVTVATPDLEPIPPALTVEATTLLSSDEISGIDMIKNSRSA